MASIKNKAIVSESFAFAKSLVSKNMEVVGVKIKNKFLCLELDQASFGKLDRPRGNMRFSVRN